MTTIRMMTTMNSDQKGKLLHAATLIDEVVKGMNRDFHHCEHCRMMVRENPQDYFRAQQLDAMVKKLTNFATQTEQVDV